ncbi:MAG: GNAT family N-acetyltransferase [Gordonia sp. (in: high G+C Gram-positive bacteria)]
MRDQTVLDDPFTGALLGRQQRFARRRGDAVAFDLDVSVFYGHPRALTPADFDDLEALAGPGGTVGLRDVQIDAPDDWTFLERFDLVQYTGEGMTVAHDADLVRLGPADVDEMTALVTLTNPGPFRPRTIELGAYLGYRDPFDGRLLAMAGQRLALPGWTEISAVCTHPDARGRGLASRLIRAVGALIVDAGDAPFLHTTADNPARSLYESLGFTQRSNVPLDIYRMPGEG